MAPTVSVVIPTFNRRARLGRVLAALASQTFPRDEFEVVLVSDGSTDGTDDYLESSNVPLPIVAVSQPNAGPAAARNRGVEIANGDLVLFVDDDVVAAPDLVEQHAKTHQRDGAGLVVIGPMLTPPDFRMNAWVSWEQAMLYKQYAAMKRGDWTATFRQFYTGNASLARSTLLDAGGFDTRFRRAEDVELAYRLDEAGCRFDFNPDAVGWHYADRSFASWLANAHDYGVNEVIFARDHHRPELLDIVRNDFAGRHRLVRWASRVGVRHPRVAPPLQSVLSASARASARVHAGSMARLLFSGTYNLAYYRGVADELGGPEAFRKRILEAPEVRA